MTSHEDLGFFRRMLATLGRAFGRGILGRASPDDTKQFTERGAYWDRVIAAQFAGAPEQPSPSVRDTARGSSEPEFEPVHGWTRRQLEDYLRRNPGYRLTYEVDLKQRCSAFPQQAAILPGRRVRKAAGTQTVGMIGQRRPDALDGERESRLLE